MDTEQLKSVNRFYDQQCTWKMESFYVNTYANGLEEPRYVTKDNLIEHLGKTSHANPGSTTGMRIYLADFKENSKKYRKEVLLPTLNKVVQQSGFTVVSDGYSNKKLTLPIVCSRGVMYQNPNEKKDLTRNKEDARVEAILEESESTGITQNTVLAGRKTKTFRQVDKAEKCGFRFQLYWDPTHSLWYFHEFGAGNVTHTGHCQLRPEEVKVPIKALSPEAWQLARDMVNINADAALNRAILEERTGFLFSSDQLRHLRLSDRRDILVSEGCDQLSTLSPFSRTTQGAPTSPFWDTDLLAIPNQRPRLKSVRRMGGQHKVTTPMTQNQNDAFWDEVERDASKAKGTTVEEVEDLANEIDSAARQAMRIRKAVQLSGCKKILIGVSWTFDAARETLAKFPEATASDITEGTNS